LQIQLFVGLGWNKACRRPLHGLGYGMGVSEIILVPLPKRLCICQCRIKFPQMCRSKIPQSGGFR